MILFDKIKILINSGRQKKFYQQKGYTAEIKKFIEINFKDLPLNSNIKIDVKCDICGSVKKISYRNYLANIQNSNFYSCNKCVNIKNKKTRFEIYGDENYNNVEKQKKTCLERFGVDNFTKTDEYKRKIEDVNLSKYGEKYYLITQEFKDKARETCISKYKKEHYSQTEESIKKAENTCMKRYGETYYSKTEECKEKVKRTSIKKFGHEYYSSSSECRDRVKKSYLEHFGVEHPFQDKDFFEKFQIKSFKLKTYKNLTYQGSYELDFLMKYYDKFRIEKPKSLKYKYNKKNRVYHPDFFLPEFNLIVEVKNSYLAERDCLIIEQKKNSVLQNDYNYIMIVDKDYTEFNNLYSI